MFFCQILTYCMKAVSNTVFNHGIVHIRLYIYINILTKYRQKSEKTM